VLLNKAADRTRILFNERLAALGIKSKHYGILFLLAQQGPLSQVELAQQIEVDRAMMVQFIDHLEQMQLVERAPNPKDRRSHAITLTPKGQQTLQEALELAKNVEEEILSPLSAEERQQFHGLLMRLLQE
jgi:DNA-binding MarR family transcriptional regulator